MQILIYPIDKNKLPQLCSPENRKAYSRCDSRRSQTASTTGTPDSSAGNDGRLYCRRSGMAAYRKKAPLPQWRMFARERDRGCHSGTIRRPVDLFFLCFSVLQVYCKKTKIKCISLFSGLFFPVVTGINKMVIVI